MRKNRPVAFAGRASAVGGALNLSASGFLHLEETLAHAVQSSHTRGVSRVPSVRPPLRTLHVARNSAQPPTRAARAQEASVVSGAHGLHADGHM